MVSVDDCDRLVKGWGEEPCQCYALDSSASNFTPVMPQNYLLVNSKHITGLIFSGIGLESLVVNYVCGVNSRTTVWQIIFISTNE